MKLRTLYTKDKKYKYEVIEWNWDNFEIKTYVFEKFLWFKWYRQIMNYNYTGNAIGNLTDMVDKAKDDIKDYHEQLNIKQQKDGEGKE